MLLTNVEIKFFNLEEYVYLDENDDWQPKWCDNGTIQITDKWASYWNFNPVTKTWRINSQID